jgi:hypothetical protein
VVQLMLNEPCPFPGAGCRLKKKDSIEVLSRGLWSCIYRLWYPGLGER